MSRFRTDALHERRLVDVEVAGYALLEAGRYSEAGSKFATLIEMAPNDRRGYAGAAITAECQWNWPRAIELWDRCLGAAPEFGAVQSLSRKANCLVQIGRIREAKGILRDLTEHFEGLEGLAQISTLQEAPSAAIERWEQCTIQFPDQVAAFLGKAGVLLQSQQYGEADALLDHVVAVWPDSAAAGALWAQCATLAKDWDRARARWETVLARHSSHPDARKGYARYLAATSAEEAAKRFFAQLNDNAVALSEALLDFHLARDDLGRAVEEAHKLVLLESEKPWHWFTEAIFRMRHGTPESLNEATRILEDMHERCPVSVPVAVQLAEAYIRRNLGQRADELIRAIPDEDRRAEVAILRAWASQREGRDLVAKQTWDALLERKYFPAVHARIWNLTRIDQHGSQTRPGDVLLFSFMRNERPRLEWFLRHYRSLGVDKFVILDNASADTSAAFLLQQPDVILYQSSDRYSLAGDGMRWINELIERHGRNNWCIYVDADEALIFPGCETHDLHQLTEYLDRKRYEALLAPMLDMYPEKLDMGDADGPVDWQSSYVFFDSRLDSYEHHFSPYRELYGGIRRRLFDGYQLMNKAPLVNGAAGIRFLLSGHRITPAKVADVSGALLHYHLVYLLQAKYRSLVLEAIRQREFPSNATERVRSMELLPKIASSGSLLGEDSVRYESSEQLVKLGVLHASPDFRQFLRAAKSR
jgi:predicted Zn-dependent protease